MKILLIQAKLSSKLVAVNPPFGLMYISSVLKKNGYKDIKLIHLDIDEIDWKREIRKYKPDIVGISAITAQGLSLHEIASFVKEELQSKVIVGGAYPTYYYEDILKDQNIDLCVLGEGEKVFLKILDYYKGLLYINEIPSIAYRKDETIKVNNAHDIYYNLDDLPYPDYSIIDIEKYQKKVSCSIYSYGSRFFPIHSSRGCPFSCIFCHKIHGKRFRAHSPQRVISEMKYLNKKHGIKIFEFMDDCPNLDKNRFKTLIKMFKKELPEDTHIYFSGGLVSSLLDYETIDLMKESRVKYFAIAIESGSNRIQKLIRKNVDLEKAHKIIKYATQKGIFVHGLFMIGFPFETKHDIHKTIHFLKNSSLHTMLLSTVMVYKGTELSKMVKPSDIKNIHNDNKHYSDYNGFIENETLTSKQLKFLKFKANLIFYLDPIRIFRILISLPNKNLKLLIVLFKKFIKRLIILK